MTEDEAGLAAVPARNVVREVELRLAAGGLVAERERCQFEHLSSDEMDLLIRRERTGGGGRRL